MHLKDTIIKAVSQIGWVTGIAIAVVTVAMAGWIALSFSRMNKALDKREEMIREFRKGY